jgi:hypothetical protein
MQSCEHHDRKRRDGVILDVITITITIIVVFMDEGGR